MTSKNSLLARMRENARRRHWLWIVNCCVLLFWFPIQFVSICSSLLRGYGSVYSDSFIENAANRFYTLTGPREAEKFLYLLIAFAVVAAMQGYSYLYHTKKVDMYHSQPISKTVRFFSIYLNGILTFVCPYIVNVILTVAVAQFYHVLNAQFLGTAMFFMGTNILAYIMIYSTAVLGVTLTGNFLAGGFGIAALLGTEWGLRRLVYEYCQSYFHTFSEYSKDSIMSPALSVATMYLQDIRTVAVNSATGIAALWESMGAGIFRMCLIGLLTLAAAYFVYYIRPSETAGRSVAFRWIRPVVKILAMILAALTLGLVLHDMSGGRFWIVVMGLFFGVIAAHCILEIIFELRFSAIFRNLWQLFAGAAAVALLYSIFQFDLIQYDTKMPKVESVDSVAIAFTPQQNDSYAYSDTDGNSLSLLPYIKKYMFFTDIDAVLELVAADYYHQTGESELLDLYNQYTPVTIMYRMKNGKEVYRTYFVDMASQSENMDSILQNEEYRAGVFPIMREDYMNFAQRIQIEFESIFGIVTIDGSDVEAVRDALKKDMEGYSYSMLRDEEQLGVLHVGGENFLYTSDTYAVYPSYQNTLRLLEQRGYYDSSADLKSMTRKIEINYHSDVSFYDDTVTREYEDTEQISQLLDCASVSDYGSWWKDQSKIYQNMYIFIYLTDGSIRSIVFDKEKELPDWLIEDLGYEEGGAVQPLQGTGAVG